MSFFLPLGIFLCRAKLVYLAMHRHLTLQQHLQMQKKCAQRQTTTQHIESKPANFQALVVHMQEICSAVPWAVTCCSAPLYSAQRPKIVRYNHPMLYPAHPPDSPKLNCKQIHKTNPLIALGSFFFYSLTWILVPTYHM